ncbi:hypothetical protein J2T13_002663 [Paenibacillus sp. DS2015]|uniref:hypothetical protein n=1 Tax=Paenibacillus sp. DS2015 TaxID=3373917 RepID=UPI003D1C8A39
MFIYGKLSVYILGIIKFGRLLDEKILSIIGLSCVLLLNPLTNLKVHAEVGLEPLLTKEEIVKEMEVEREKQVEYHINEYKSLASENRQTYLMNYGLDDKVSLNRSADNSVDLNSIENYFEDKLDKAYIYTMDDNGYVYNEEGDILEKLDLQEETFLAEDNSNVSSITPQSVTLDSTINGYNSGAFVRQTTFTGYKGIKTTFLLPTDSYFETPNINVTGYLYNGLDVLSSTYPTGYKLEAGLQYSETSDNYSASIRPHGSTQIFKPEGYTVNAPRYKAGTSITSNLLYDTTSSKIKYFVDGTNINGVNQYIYFYYGKSFSSSEIASLCVKRVTALAKEGYTGTNIGNVQVTYTSTVVTSNSGSTSNLTSSMLNTHKYNGKTYGTSDNPSTGITKSGNLNTQKIIINTTGF